MDNNTESAVKTEKIQRGKPFAKGKSGNPSGRPKGSRNTATLAVQQLLDNESEAITRKLIEKAKEGDMLAIKLVMERVCPPRKDAPVTFTFSHIKTMEGLIAAVDQILQQISHGDITPQEAERVIALIEQQRKNIVSDKKYAVIGDLF